MELVSYLVNVFLGGLGVTSSPRDPSFTVSNPAEVDEFFFQNVKILSTSPPGWVKPGVPSLRFWAR